MLTESVEQTQLRKLRDEMKPHVSMEAMARASKITLATYRKVEKGNPTTYSTAKAVLAAMNLFRRTSEPRLQEIPETEIPKLFNLM